MKNGAPLRRIVFPVLVMAVAALIFVLSSQEKDDAGMVVPKKMRTLTSEQLLTRANRLEVPMRLRTATDILPGGYAAAMAPVMIDWEASGPWDEDPFVIIHNLNHGGNPVDGTTVFCSARIPLKGVEAAEFTLLPLDNIGKEGLIQHGQLRFVFAADQPVELLNFGDAEMGSDSNIRDLVFSWEAWRPPSEGFNVMTGMDPAAYLLSPRAFSGPTRFLDDALGHRDWFSYRLRLPNGQAGLVELLKINLALCDGVARHAVSKILKQGEDEWASQAPRGNEEAADSLADWEELREVVAPKNVVTDTLINLPERDLAYQTLLRSCATMALYTINVAVDRLVAAGHTDGLDLDHRMLPDLGVQEDWMTELADTNLKGIFLRAPAAVRYLRENPQAFPKKIPKQLERAGLLELDQGGKVKKFHYRIDGTTPYGTLQENLIK
jgi:hemin uptake protein HemP